jgi:predicted RNA-binding Zn-ribbon protein involved in translation (DUF1610 family)
MESKYQRIVCRRCDWSSHKFSAQKTYAHGACPRCGYIVVDWDHIPVVDPLTFEEGEG